MSILICATVKYETNALSGPDWITFRVFDQEEWEVFKEMVTNVSELSISIGESPREAYLYVKPADFLSSARVCSSEEFKGYSLLYKTNSWSNFRDIFEEFEEDFDAEPKNIVRDRKLSRELLEIIRPIYDKCTKMFKDDKYEDHLDEIADIISDNLDDVGFDLICEDKIYLLFQEQDQRRLAEEHCRKDQKRIDYVLLGWKDALSITEKEDVLKDQILVDSILLGWKENALSMSEKEDLLQNLKVNRAELEKALDKIRLQLDHIASKQFDKLLEDRGFTVHDDLDNMISGKKDRYFTCEHIQLRKDRIQRPHYRWFNQEQEDDFTEGSTMKDLHWYVSYTCEKCTNDKVAALFCGGMYSNFRMFHITEEGDVDISKEYTMFSKDPDPDEKLD